ncbi:MAG: TetR/AcrR family transcriptional regulator [Burkholderiales bacterium]|nr:TetR/AcrR family transcriptional regulator [Burkholderiales bacterium]
MAKNTKGKTRSHVETLVLAYAATEPELGQFRVADALHQRGVQISASGVRAIWKRHQLETLYKRISALPERDPRGKSRLSGVQRARFKRAERRWQLLETDSKKDRPGNSMTLRHHLLVVAARAFHRHGYKGATLKEIAEAAGILPGSIYHYFRSKEDLFSQVHDAGFKEINTSLNKALAGKMDPRQRLEAACAAHLKVLLSENALAGFTGSSLFNSDMGMLTSRSKEIRGAYETRFRALIDALDLPPHIDRRVFRLALLGALNWTQVWYKRGRQSPAAIARALIDIYCR